MLKKYFATKTITIDGRTYNPGDLVICNRDIYGLRRVDNVVEKRPNQPGHRRYKVSHWLNRDQPEVSVVITFHNQLEFINQCLGGFYRQSIERPYEIIAIVDKSDQDEVNYIKNCYPEVTLAAVQYGNANMSRNHGLKLARGKYVAFFDGDDFPFGEYLNHLLVALEKNPWAGFAYSRFEHELFGQSLGKLPRCNVFEWSESWADFSPITNTPIMIYRDKAPFWDERLEIMQDTAYCLSLKASGLRGIHVREELWYYRHHPGGIWNKQGNTSRRAVAMDILKRDYKLKTTKARVTFMSLISRDVVLDEYFGQIKNLGLPKNAHWFILVDSNQEDFINKVKGYQQKFENLFLSSRMFVTGEGTLTYSRDFGARGMRIANFIKIIINQAYQKWGGSEFLFMVEDDTIAPRGAFKKLLPLVKKNAKTVYASGLECGRGYTKHTGICWLEKNESGEIVRRLIPSMKQLDKPIEIGGGGWYCWVGKAKELAEFMSNYKARCLEQRMIGVDVFMVHDLKEAGYESWCDPRVQCKHYDERRKRWLPAKVGKGYDIYYSMDKLNHWVMELNEIKI